MPDVKFVAVTGDFVSAVFTAGKERTDENSRLVKGISIMNNLTVPYYMVMGNHDYKIDNDRDSDTYFPESEILEMEELWEDVAGFDPYYFIEDNGWNFIFLNSMRGRYLKRFFDEEQLDWLSDLLTQNKPTLLFFHHPIQTDNTPEVYLNKYKEKDLITAGREPRFFEIVEEHKENIKGIFFGHVHIWAKDVLFETIPTVLTNSLADQPGLPFHLIKVDSGNSVIKIERVHLNKD
ncbi:MAG: metallophosphoesterase [Melioribacteraceae bacterium]|nr:metallophosphoesterase [Melioribacteraceae bacterium]